MLQLCVLGSGSSGNCIYLSTGKHRLLVDAGLSGKEIERRLKVIGVDPASIAAVCVTHEHEDHIGTLGLLKKRYGMRLYANSGTVEAIELAGKESGMDWNIFSTGYRFAMDDIEVEPFSVPHDAMDPVGFVFRCGSISAGVATDIGTATGLVKQRLRGCSILVLESNHDTDMLHGSERPWSLKQRIAGRHGHFSNEQASGLVGEVADAKLQVVFLAHLSKECNDPKKAVKAMRSALDARGLTGVAVELTNADEPSRLWTVDV